jgi:hypothetical protein
LPVLTVSNAARKLCQKPSKILGKEPRAKRKGRKRSDGSAAMSTNSGLKAGIFRENRKSQVDPLGFEPRTTESKSAVLPLHHGSLTYVNCRIYNDLLQ